MNPQTGRPPFAFRLHQFLSKGGTVFTALEPEGTRAIESEFQVELPGERRLFPLAFCRECGQEYLMARRQLRDGHEAVFTAARCGIDNPDFPDEARKLLTFVDNRQNASLQAGHFNDFALVVQLRSALYRALLDAGEDGLDTLDLGVEVTRAPGLQHADFAQAPDAIVGLRHTEGRCAMSKMGYLLDQQRIGAQCGDPGRHGFVQLGSAEDAPQR